MKLSTLFGTLLLPRPIVLLLQIPNLLLPQSFYFNLLFFWLLQIPHHTHYPAQSLRLLFPLFFLQIPFLLSFNWTNYTLYLPTSLTLCSICSINQSLHLQPRLESYGAIEQILRIFEQYIHSPSESLPRRYFTTSTSILVYILYLIYTRHLFIHQTFFNPTTYDNR